jgi:hypothetical protein
VATPIPPRAPGRGFLFGRGHDVDQRSVEVVGDQEHSQPAVHCEDD